MLYQLRDEPPVNDVLEGLQWALPATQTGQAALQTEDKSRVSGMRMGRSNIYEPIHLSSLIGNLLIQGMKTKILLYPL